MSWKQYAAGALVAYEVATGTGAPDPTPDNTTVQEASSQEARSAETGAAVGEAAQERRGEDHDHK